MKSESLLSRLQRHQADTLAVLDRAARLLDGDPAMAHAGLAALRWELARRLRAY